MDTKPASKSGRAVTRDEMPTSPDAGLNETFNTERDVLAPPVSDWLDSPAPSKPAFHQTDAVIEMLPDLDDDTLEELSGAVAFEEDSRTPTRRGAEAFWKAYRPARRDYRGDIQAAEENLGFVEGAALAFFKKRGAAVGIGAGAKVDARMSVSIETVIRVRDPRLGRLWVEIYAGATDATVMVRRTWGGDTLLAAEGGVADVVEKFAAWAARQP